MSLCLGGWDCFLASLVDRLVGRGNQLGVYTPNLRAALTDPRYGSFGPAAVEPEPLFGAGADPAFDQGAFPTA